MPHRVRVGTQEIQERFEEEGLREPEFFGIVVVEDGWLPLGPNAPPDEPIGTISVELSYRRGSRCGDEVARAHVFKQPNGTFGASGVPDPKQVLIGDTLYILDKRLDAEGLR